jgi:hypothetical protein
VISGCLCNCGSPRTSHARQNMAALKKHFEFYTSSFAKVRALIAGQNPFSQRKNLPNTGETQLVPTGEIDEKIDALVTTSHVFLQHPPRTTGPLLPISQPIFEVSRGQAHRDDREGGGGQPGRARRKPCIDKLARNFIPNGAPCPIPVVLKKTRFAAAAQFRAVPDRPFA